MTRGLSSIFIPQMRIFVAILLGLCLGCVSSERMKTYYNDVLGYELKYPGHWTISDGGQGSVDVLGEKANLYVVSTPTDDLTFEQGYKLFVMDSFDQGNQCVISASGTSQINGHKAKWIEYRYGDQDSMTTLVYLIQANDRFYLINTLSTTDQYPKYKGTLEGIIKSFKAK
jgi:hypothetical protein